MLAASTIPAYTAAEFRRIATSFTEHTLIKVESHTLYVWPVKGDSYTDIAFKERSKSGPTFALLMSTRPWPEHVWQEQVLPRIMGA
jgi:hypothetical protein